MGAGWAADWKMQPGCINERRGPAAEDALFVNLHGGGDDDAAHTFGNVLALEDVISGLHILQTAIGAAALKFILTSQTFKHFPVKNFIIKF